MAFAIRNADEANAPGSSFNATSMATSTTAATNNMRRNSRPLPKNTVAEKRYSRGPSRSRTTPTNHRKAILAKGDEVERQRNLAGVGGEPPARRLRIGGNRAPQQSEAR